LDELPYAAEYRFGGHRIGLRFAFPFVPFGVDVRNDLPDSSVKVSHRRTSIMYLQPVSVPNLPPPRASLPALSDF
jgi:hypothetical protein